MTLATFRTECYDDGERVPELLKELGLTLVSEKMVPDGPRWYLWIFTVNIPDQKTVDNIKEQMEFLINNDKRFIDLHRCYQTFQEGENPKSW